MDSTDKRFYIFLVSMVSIWILLMAAVGFIASNTEEIEVEPVTQCETIIVGQDQRQN